MGLLKLTTENAPAAPAAGTVTTYYDTATKPTLRLVDQNGNDNQVSPLVNSSGSSNAQAPAAATRTYLTGSAITVPTKKVKVGTIYRCRFAMTKTAAGVATSTIDVAVGTAGTTADTARCSFTKPAGTAAADEGFVDILVTVSTASATGVLTGECAVLHNGNTVGHMTIPCAVLQNTSGTFDLTVANLIFGVCITSGAADVITITQVFAEMLNC